MTAEVFDDGRADGPAGAAGPVERVVVVGAGIAGLTVANALAHGGVECVVVEARDRIGGRLHTVDLAGFPVDLGGSWIHTPIGNPVRAFAQQAGVRCRSANPLPELAGRGRRRTARKHESGSPPGCVSTTRPDRPASPPGQQCAGGRRSGRGPPPPRTRPRRAQERSRPSVRRCPHLRPPHAQPPPPPPPERQFARRRNPQRSNRSPPCR